MHIYIASPIFNSEKDTSNVNLEPFAWLCLEYKETISNRLEATEKEEKYQKFASESQVDFDNKNVYEFIYLDRLGHSDKRNGFIKAIENNPTYEPNDIVLIGVNEPFEARNRSKFSWLLGSLLFGS